MAMTTKKVLVGVGIATAVGAVIALAAGGASASGREPWTDPLELPTQEEITEIKTTICTLERGGVEPSGLVLATLENVYIGLPWTEILEVQVEGDHPSVRQAVAVVAALVQAYLALPEAQRESWCADPTLPPPIPLPPLPTPPAPGPAIPSNVIGGGWESWPEKSKWPTQGSIGASMNLIGYPVEAGFLAPGYKITTQKNRDAIKKFQADWNAFRSKPVCAAMLPHDATGHVGSLFASAPKVLTKDGWIGPNTWKALRVAFYANAVQGASWLQILSDCKKV